MLYAVTSCALAAGLIFVVRHGPAWVRLPGGRDAGAEARRLEQLRADQEVLRRRADLIRSLRADLLEGRRTLREAAAALRAENEAGPPHLDMHVEYLPGRTEEERYCRSVLAQVRAFAAGDSRAPAALARLEAELRGAFPATPRAVSVPVSPGVVSSTAAPPPR